MVVPGSRPTALSFALLAVTGLGVATVALAQSVTPATPTLEGVDVFVPGEGWTRMRRDGCEVRSVSRPRAGLAGGRVSHTFRCADGARAAALIDAFAGTLEAGWLSPEASPRARPTRREHRAVALLPDGTRRLVAGPAWREDAQRAFELAAAWDALFEADDDEEAAHLELWTPYEASDDFGAPIRIVSVGERAIECVREGDDTTPPTPASGLAERARAFAEAWADEPCELSRSRGCERTSCGAEVARAWLALLETLPPECSSGCRATVAPRWQRRAAE